MSLSAHDRQALNEIEEWLASTDPHFAAKLSAFCRLTDGEAMPARERIRALRRRTDSKAIRELLSGGSQARLPRRSGMRRARGAEPRARRSRLSALTAVIWLVISFALITVALVLSHSGSAACTSWPAASCGSRAPGHMWSGP